MSAAALSKVPIAADAYNRVLELVPDDAVDDLASTHGALGNVYASARQADRALAHYVKSIQYDERQDNRYRASVTRYNAAVTLANAGRRHDAILYARAALRTSKPSALAPPLSPMRQASSLPNSKRNQQMKTTTGDRA